MADIHSKTGSSVYTSDGVLFGTVEAVTEEEVMVNVDGHIVRVPRSVVDAHQSSPDRLMLTTTVETGERPAGSTIPIHAEELSVRVTERDQGKVQIRKSVERVPVHEDIELGMDVVEIERVASGEEFDEMPQQWQDGDTLVIPVVEEVLVLTRRFRIVENVRVARRREFRTERIEAELRREVVSFHEEDEHGNPVDS